MSYRRTIIIAMVSGIILSGCNSYPDPFFEYQDATTPAMLGQGTLSRDSLQWNNAFVAATKELYYTKSHATGADIRKFVWEEGAFMDKGKVEFPEDAIHSDVYVDEKGEVMLFSSTMLESETDTIGDWNIWKSERVGRSWQKPELYFSQPMPENEFYPTLADSGNLYFTITPHGSQNGDIHVSRLVNGVYTSPEPLDPSINSESNEGDAFIAPDESYIIFASFDRVESLGKSDLYISLKKADGNWSQPIWMGREINSAGFDGSPFVTQDGKFLIFTSSRGSTKENPFFNHYIVRFNLEQYHQ